MPSVEISQLVIEYNTWLRIVGLAAMNEFSVVLEKYQNYATSDHKETGDPEDVFVENHGKVINNAMPFNELGNVNESNVLLRKTERNTVLATGVDTAEQLN